MLSGAGVFFSGATDSLAQLVRVLGAAWFGQAGNEFLQCRFKALGLFRVNRPVFVCPCRSIAVQQNFTAARVWRPLHLDRLLPRGLHRGCLIGIELPDLLAAYDHIVVAVKL